MLAEPYFDAPAPKSTGRERFDEHWLDARLEAAGVEPVVPPTTIREGVRILMAADPDGNWVEFLQVTA